MTKKPPQVGEMWFDGFGNPIGPLLSDNHPEYTLIHPSRTKSWRANGVFWHNEKAKDNLVLIHKDATGKVIHATFDPALIGKDDSTESDPITKAIAEADDRAKGLRDLQTKLARAATMQGDLATLRLEIAILREKYPIEAKPTTWYPIKKPKAKKAGKTVK